MKKIFLLLIISALSFNINAQMPGLLQEFNFNSNSTNEAGTISFSTASPNIFYVPDRFGIASRAININNVGSEATIIGLPYGNAQRSVSMWVKLNSFNANNYNMFYSYGTGSPNAASGGGCSNNLIYHFGYDINHSATSNQALNEWTHYVFTYDGAYSKIYKNGVMIDSKNIAWNTSNNANKFKIGVGVDGELWFNGAIDELQIYNRELTSAEVLHLYNPDLNAMQQWNFDNSYANTTANINFSSNAGTSFTNDRFGAASKALRIVNTGSTATVPGLPYGANARTVSMWVKLNSFNSNNYNMFYSYGTSGLLNQSNGGGISASQAFHFGYNNNQQTTVSGGFTANIWYHFVFVFNGGVSRIYRNGYLLGRQTLTGWNTVNNNDLFRLGIGVGNELWFDGAIDDLRLYTRSLSGAEVNNLYARENTAMPVKLQSFTGALKNEKSVLNWTSSSEYNAANYEVEYSNDGKEFTKAGTVEAKGNSSTKQQYSFTHSINTQPVHYYRLKMNDKDGSFKYSNIVKLKSETKQFEAFVYPTITNGSATLSISSPEKLNTTISIHTIEGKKIKQQNSAVAQGSQTIPLDLSQLTNGYYLITISGNGYNKTLKVIKQ